MKKTFLLLIAFSALAAGLVQPGFGHSQQPKDEGSAARIARIMEAELARLVNAIAEGQPSQSFMTAIGERERELQSIANKLLSLGPDRCALHSTNYEPLQSHV